MKTQRECKKYGSVSIEENCKVCSYYTYRTTKKGIEVPMPCAYQQKKKEM